MKVRLQEDQFDSGRQNGLEGTQRINWKISVGRKREVGEFDWDKGGGNRDRGIK